MATAIKVENLSKAYQLGTIGTGTLSRDLERWIARLRGKEDPFLTIGEANDRSIKGSSDVVLSLNNLSFDIEQGDAVGIIGRNGAGKSTLLKLLSRVTSPTTGSIKVKGRIASLLEVGTGFHPELTGRENIFLNGAILGMRKREIARKFDQIVDFAGVERYIDTPVKRYSSGMYVRLAFAVAAHLESEILIVDEVLAVGDAEFQKKCLGKMGDVSKGEGRTVLFVSHNMASIRSLCNTGILLSNGALNTTGDIENVLNSYKKLGAVGTSHFKEWDSIENAPGNSVAKILMVCARNESGQIIDEIDVTESFFLEMTYIVLEDNNTLWHSFNLYDDIGTHIFDTHSTTSELYYKNHPKGKFKARVHIPANFLNEGKLSIGCAIFNHEQKQIHVLLSDLISIQIVDYNYTHTKTSRGLSPGRFAGTIRPLLNWQTENL